jgi:hypothetical protein
MRSRNSITGKKEKDGCPPGHRGESLVDRNYHAIFGSHGELSIYLLNAWAGAKGVINAENDNVNGMYVRCVAAYVI